MTSTTSYTQPRRYMAIGMFSCSLMTMVIMAVSQNWALAAAQVLCAAFWIVQIPRRTKHGSDFLNLINNDQIDERREQIKRVANDMTFKIMAMTTGITVLVGAILQMAVPSVGTAIMIVGVSTMAVLSTINLSLKWFYSRRM